MDPPPPNHLLCPLGVGVGIISGGKGRGDIHCG